MNRVGRHTKLAFRVPPFGRFDAALVPVGKVGALPGRFVLALERGLTIQEQVALYGHAVGHLLLNYQYEQLGRLPEFNPRQKYAHADTLAELRLLETFKPSLDARILETFPDLTLLLNIPEEPQASIQVATADLRLQLGQAGWCG